MELRKKVKRPQRYEPEPDTHLQETYTPHALRPAFPSPFVDFNPDLPPATFPTFDQPRLADLSGRYHTTNSRTEASPLGPEAPTGQQLPRDEVEELLVPSYTSQGIWQASGGPQKQVLVDKLQLLRRKMDRSEEDWISQEMETSDEEEQVDGGHSRAVHRVEGRPLWKNLPDVLQMSIVDMLSRHLTLEEACQRLRLTEPQQREVLKHQARRQRLEDFEDSNIRSLHAQQMSLFLDRNYNSSRPITQTTFRKSIEKHLYKNLEEADHHTVTKKELVDAQIFLQAIGLDPDLIGEWSDSPDDQDPSKVDSCQQLAQLSSGSPNMHQTARSASGRIKASPHQDFLQRARTTLPSTSVFQKTIGRAKLSIPVKRVMFEDRGRMSLYTGPKPGTAYPNSRLESVHDHTLLTFNNSRQHPQKELQAGLLDEDAQLGLTLSKRLLVGARADTEQEATPATGGLETLQKPHYRLLRAAASDGKDIVEPLNPTSLQLAAFASGQNRKSQSSLGGRDASGMKRPQIFSMPSSEITVLCKEKPPLVASSPRTPSDATPQELTSRGPDSKANTKKNNGNQRLLRDIFGAPSKTTASAALRKGSSHTEVQGAVYGDLKPSLARDRQISTSTSIVSSRSEHKSGNARRAYSKSMNPKLSISEASTTEKGQSHDQPSVENTRLKVEERKRVKRRGSKSDVSRNKAGFPQNKAVVQRPRARKGPAQTTAGQPITALK